MSAGGAPILIATRNAGKLRELQPMLAAAGFAAVDLETAGIAEHADEDGLEIETTFTGNALAKAHYFHARSGLPTIADDSGLVVELLGGAPGVRSKRYAGRTDLTGAALDAANNAALLAAIETAIAQGSGSAGSSVAAAPLAAFVCAAAYVDGHRSHVVEGRAEGHVVSTGASGGFGFGYDPHFFSAELGKTFAEAARSEKQAVSHRGRAVRALVAWLEEAR